MNIYTHPSLFGSRNATSNQWDPSLLQGTWMDLQTILRFRISSETLLTLIYNKFIIKFKNKTPFQYICSFNEKKQFRCPRTTKLHVMYFMSTHILVRFVRSSNNWHVQAVHTFQGLVSCRPSKRGKKISIDFPSVSNVTRLRKHK